MLWKFLELFMLKEYAENDVVYCVSYVSKSHTSWFTEQYKSELF
jgi:hypothetical protein